MERPDCEVSRESEEIGDHAAPDFSPYKWGHFGNSVEAGHHRTLSHALRLVFAVPRRVLIRKTETHGAPDFVREVYGRKIGK